jgi:nitrite reductase/ring-hydroxylating ferredoxin subunit
MAEHEPPVEGLSRRGFMLLASWLMSGLCWTGCSWVHPQRVAGMPDLEGDHWLVSFEKHPALREPGGTVLLGKTKIGDYNGRIFVRRIGPDKAVVLGEKCRHLGCGVAWHPQDKLFICPCHGSRYDAEGEVVKGPTKKGLYAWEARVESHGILISDEALAIRI